jgi:hypothetical protein
MSTISNFWWLWLIITVVLYGVSFWFQLRRGKQVINVEYEEPKKILRGITFALFFFILGSVSGIFFLIGIMLKTIEYTKGL